LESRIANIETWVNRFLRLAPVAWVSMELVKFDTQAMENPEISGVEYQQGTLLGYEIREYLLEKWGRKCAYCGATGVKLQVEHIHASSRNGSDRVSNLTLACEPCNQKKGNRPVEEFLAHDPVRLARIKAQAKIPLKDAAALNAARWELFHRLKTVGLPLETGSGGRTKFNRARQEYPKTHWIDAACVGECGACVALDPGLVPLRIKATGHGTRQMCRMDKYGFPRTSAKSQRRVRGFCTGDIVKAVVGAGKKAGIYIGRVAVRASGSFNITCNDATVQGIGWRYCTLLHNADGYGYSI
jgi:hypothetical protein